MNYKFIESEAELAVVCDGLLEEDIIGVDLEADAMHCFHEKICLIQIATQKEAFLIDPFVLKDLSVFKRVLESPDVVKVFHGADFDVRSLDRDLSVQISNLFDTEIACRFLGMKERGLAALLKRYFNVDADKKYQKVDWAMRPLKPEMIAYSVEDVAHLVKLYHIIRDRLAQKERLSWAREEFEIQTRVRYENNHAAPLFIRFKGAGKMDNRSLAVLENLLQARLSIARKKDQPLFKVMSNQSLMTMAFEKPLTIDRMVKIRALSPKQADMYGNSCVKAIVDAMALAHKDLPSYPRTRRPKKDLQVMDRIKRLKKMRERLSGSMEIEPGFLLNNALISAIAVENPETKDSLKTINSIRNWQIEAMGDILLSTLGH